MAETKITLEEAKANLEKHKKLSEEKFKEMLKIVHSDLGHEIYAGHVEEHVNIPVKQLEYYRRCAEFVRQLAITGLPYWDDSKLYDELCKIKISAIDIYDKI